MQIRNSKALINYVERERSFFKRAQLTIFVICRIVEQVTNFCITSKKLPVAQRLSRHRVAISCFVQGAGLSGRVPGWFCEYSRRRWHTSGCAQSQTVFWTNASLAATPKTLCVFRDTSSPGVETSDFSDACSDSWLFRTFLVFENLWD